MRRNRSTSRVVMILFLCVELCSRESLLSFGMQQYVCKKRGSFCQTIYSLFFSSSLIFSLLYFQFTCCYELLSALNNFSVKTCFHFLLTYVLISVFGSLLLLTWQVILMCLFTCFVHFLVR